MVRLFEQHNLKAALREYGGRGEPAGPPPITSTSQQPGEVDDTIFSLSRRRKDRSNVCNIGHMHILIVEDDQVARDYLAKALREAGHTVDVADDGLEGLHLASSIALDIAIVDRVLPQTRRPRARAIPARHRAARRRC